jgi:prefoldin subunit 5
MRTLFSLLPFLRHMITTNDRRKKGLAAYSEQVIIAILTALLTIHQTIDAATTRINELAEQLAKQDQQHRAKLEALAQHIESVDARLKSHDEHRRTTAKPTK